MNSKFYKIFTLVLFALFTVSLNVWAENGTIKLRTAAPAGTKLRIYTYPYENTVSGADKSEFFGEFFSKGVDTEITIECNDIQQLEVYGCQLYELTIVSAPGLSILKCYNNEIETLNVSACPNLEVLNCKDNNLKALDLTSNNLLTEVDASGNKITNISLGSQDLLKKLSCGNNPLASIDLSTCPALEELNIQNCGLKAIDLHNNIKLWWVHVYGNGLAGSDMKTFIANLPEAAAATGMLYIVNTIDENESNVCLMDDVKACSAKKWVTCDYLNGAESDSMIGKIYLGADYVPTVSDRVITMTTSRNAGETVKLNIKSSSVISISGVKEDVVSGAATYTLTSSTIEIKGDVTSLVCTDNDLTSLTFEGGIALTSLECQNNKIEHLDLQDANRMTQMHCQHNNIKSLNLAGCTSLLRVDCYQNHLKGSAMTTMVKSLYEATNEPYLFIIDTKAQDGLENNVATKSDVSIATGKGWKVFDYINGDRWGMGTAYEGSEPTEPVLPDEYFTVTRSSKGEILLTVKFADNTYMPVIEGGEIIGWNGEALTARMTDEVLKVYGDAISIQALFAAIEGIDVTNLPNLTELNVALNDITTINLSSNSKLQTLSCECNLIESLDLSKCTAIDFVNCYGNRIKGQAMTSMIESLPVRTKAEFGQLIIRDVDYNQEGNVCLKSDVDKARQKYWAVYELRTATDNNLYLYDGEDPAGISDIEADGNKAIYDITSSTISTATPCAIEVYTIAGHLVGKVDNTTRYNLSQLPKGLYVARVGNQTLKIAK